MEPSSAAAAQRRSAAVRSPPWLSRSLQRPSRRPLRAGEFVSTGAATGVHSIAAGQSAEAIFTGIGSLRCMTTR
jgi:2-keto-4-pentenoate hydratase